MARQTRLSSGFSSTQTRGLSTLDREIEYRLGNLSHLDLFTDEFAPPGAREGQPGSDYRKPENGYQAKHDDFPARVENRLHSSGDPADQEPMDDLDEAEQKERSGIKPERDQFPGSRLERAINRKLKRMGVWGNGESLGMVKYKGYTIDRFKDKKTGAFAWFAMGPKGKTKGDQLDYASVEAATQAAKAWVDSQQGAP